MSSPQILRSVRYLVDDKGQRAAVQLDIRDWESILVWLEDMEDREALKESLLRLRNGPTKSGALPWEAVQAKWNLAQTRMPSSPQTLSIGSCPS